MTSLALFIHFQAGERPACSWASWPGVGSGRGPQPSRLLPPVKAKRQLHGHEEALSFLSALSRPKCVLGGPMECTAASDRRCYVIDTHVIRQVTL